MPIRKFAKIVGAAMRDADRARKTSSDPKWRKAQQQDRRGTLRKFETVEQTIQERDAGKRAKASKSKAARAKKR